MFLSEYYPGVTPEEIMENTGFRIDVSKAVEMEPPDVSMLEMLRKKIDPDHI
jgi:glutaconate CoA-transferase subunit B